MATTAPSKNTSSAPVRSAPEPTGDLPGEPIEAPIVYKEREPIRVERSEITEAVCAAYIALGHEAGDVSDLVTVAVTDSVMGTLLRRDVADTDEATPKLGSFRALTGRQPTR